MADILKIPTLECKGCMARDKMIQTLALEVDRLTPDNNDILELPERFERLTLDEFLTKTASIDRCRG